jgi:hypothetical protein
MNDLNSSSPACCILPTLLMRYAKQRLVFKFTAILLAVALLLLAGLGKLSAQFLLITAAPLLLLALMDAATSAQEQRCFTLLATGKGKASDSTWPQMPETTSAGLQRTVLALLSLSVWPFYLALGGILASGAATLSPSLKSPTTASAAHSGCGSSCSSGGGCGGGKGCGGASGGCSSGGCGSSSTAGVATGNHNGGIGVPRPQMPNVQGVQVNQQRPGFFPVTPAPGNRPVNVQVQPQPNINVLPQQPLPSGSLQVAPNAPAQSMPPMKPATAVPVPAQSVPTTSQPAAVVAPVQETQKPTPAPGTVKPATPE